MRRKELETTKEFALALFDQCVYATLATVRPNNTPYCIPISIVRDGAYIYFHCAKAGEKVENLGHCASVCLSCVGNTHVPEGQFSVGFESAVLFGTATEVLETEEKRHALRILSQRHTPANMPAFDAYVEKFIAVTGVWKVKIEEISGKAKKYPKL